MYKPVRSTRICCVQTLVSSTARFLNNVHVDYLPNLYLGIRQFIHTAIHTFHGYSTLKQIFYSHHPHTLLLK
jgi:hypothetical protein